MDDGTRGRRGRRIFLLGVGALVVGGAAAWLRWPASSSDRWPVTTDAIGDSIQTLPRGLMPVFAGRGEVRALYRYALEHGDELRYMPCFCGCGSLGHASNRDCYIKAVNADGTVTFTSHAAT